MREVVMVQAALEVGIPRNHHPSLSDAVAVEDIRWGIQMVLELAVVEEPARGTAEGWLASRGCAAESMGSTPGKPGELLGVECCIRELGLEWPDLHKDLCC